MKEKNFEDLNKEEKIEYPDITRELIDMYKKDQELRHKIDTRKENQPLASKLAKVDKENRKRLKEIVDKIGWPTISKVGKEGSQAAWLLAQHADQNHAFQKRCLDLIKENKDDVSKRNIAYLEDRVLVNEDKPQKYGTQFYLSEDKELRAKPIKNKDDLNERRVKMELKPFEESKMYKRMKSGYYDDEK